jgi:hypothetical protein
MFKFKKLKRGELTTAQIVTLVVLVASFLVLLFFLFFLNLGGTSEKEICRNSVSMRTSPVLPSETIPLNCKTSYICITEDGSCEQWANTEKKKVKTKDEVYQILAEQMADCWWMFGEGKLDYVGKDLTHNNYCSICSQVAFDGSLASISDFRDGNISKDDFYSYLSTHKTSGADITYSEYFFGTNNLSELKKMVSEQNNGVGGTFGKITLNKQYYVMMGITSNINNLGWILRGGAAVAIVATGVVVAVVAAPVIAGGAGAAAIGGTMSQLVIAGGLATGASVGAGVAKISNFISPEISAIVVNGNGIDNKFMAPTIIEVNQDMFKALKCENVKTLS